MFDKAWLNELYDEMVEYYINHNETNEDDCFQQYTCMTIMLSTPKEELKQMYCNKHNISISHFNTEIDV